MEPPKEITYELFRRGIIWHIEIKFDGKRVARRSTRETYKRDAEKIAEDVVAELRSGDYKLLEKPKGTLLDDISDRYFEAEKDELAASTLQSYRGRALDICQFFADTPIESIKADDIAKFVESEQGKGRKQVSIVTTLTVLSNLYSRHYRNGENHALHIYRRLRPKTRNTKKQRAMLDPSRFIRPIEGTGEISSLIMSAEKEGMESLVILMLLLHAGLRYSEVLGLQWGDVKFQPITRRSLRVERVRTPEDTIEPPKNGLSRVVHLSYELRDLLSDFRKQKFNPPADHHIVDVNRHTWRLKLFRRIKERAGLPGVKIKDLRDTYASQLLSAGFQLGYISRQLGHSSVLMTAQHYARWVDAGGDDWYSAPVELDPGEVPADWFSRATGRRETPVQVTRGHSRSRT